MKLAVLCRDLQLYSRLRFLDPHSPKYLHKLQRVLYGQRVLHHSPRSRRDLDANLFHCANPAVSVATHRHQ